MKTKLKEVAFVRVVKSEGWTNALWAGDLMVFLAKGGYKVVEYADESSRPEKTTFYRVRPFAIDGRVLKVYLEWLIAKRDPAFYVDNNFMSMTSVSRLNELELCVPPQEESERIVSILDGIERLRELRRQQEKLFCELEDSIIRQALIKGESICKKQPSSNYSI